MNNEKSYLEKIGQLIQEYRLHQNLTQAELAEKIGTSQSAINRIESGKQNITVEMLARISEELSSEIISVNSQKKPIFEFMVAVSFLEKSKLKLQKMLQLDYFAPLS